LSSDNVPYNGTKRQLILAGSHAASQTLSNIIKIGEGLVELAAKNNEQQCFNDLNQIK
jgi:hypothetical protein